VSLARSEKDEFIVSESDFFPVARITGIETGNHFSVSIEHKDIYKLKDALVDYCKQLDEKEND